MIPLRVIDTEFTLYGEVALYESLQHTEKLYAIGEIELRINRHMPNADLLQTDRIVFLEQSIDRPFQILHREIEVNENGKATENWIIKALPLKSWFSDRITIPLANKDTHDVNADAETVMKTYVEANAVNPIDAARKFPRLVIAPNQHRGPKIKRSTRFDTLSDELKTIGELTGIGWNISLDMQNKQFVFDVIDGSNRTASQTNRPPVIFSPEFKTIDTLEYTESKIDYKNTAIVAGQGEGVERKVLVLNAENRGFQRKELYVDARDIANTEQIETTKTETDEDGETITSTNYEEVNRPESEVIADLTDRGNEKLSEYEQTLFFGGQIQNSRFKYKKDWFLGDLVTLQHTHWGIMLEPRITEVKEIHEAGRPHTIEVVFDKDIPTFIDKLKRTIKENASNGTGGTSGVSKTYLDDKITEIGKVDYNWNGTELGVKVGDGSYQYVNLQGPKGDLGPQGLQGPQGIQGSKGEIGPQGPSGTNGMDGKTWYSGTTTPASATGVIGDFYLNRSTWIVYEKTAASTWTSRGTIKGDTGATGPQGPQGIQGVKGDTGQAGTTSWSGITDKPDVALNTNITYFVNNAISISDVPSNFKVGTTFAIPITNSSNALYVECRALFNEVFEYSFSDTSPSFRYKIITDKYSNTQINQVIEIYSNNTPTGVCIARMRRRGNANSGIDAWLAWTSERTIVASNGNPNSLIYGALGMLAQDKRTGTLYQKTTGINSVTTSGWKEIGELNGWIAGRVDS